MKKLISIIVPVYNCEEYIEKSISSIMEQTYKNIEIILVNDGSKDNSLKKCLELKQKDNRIQVLDKQNEGVSKTRNVGLSKANGEYIMFVDADDVLPKNSIEILLKQNEDYDWICGNYQILDSNIKGSVMEKNTTDIDAIKFKILNRYYDNYKDDCGNLRTVWGKLYKRSIIENNNILFKEKIRLFEDGIFNIEYLDYCKKVKLINEVVYYYRTNNQSAIHKYHKDFYEQDCLRINYLLNKFGNEQKYNEVISLIIYEFFLDYLKNLFRSNEKISIRKVIKNDDLIYLKHIKKLNTNFLSKKQKIVYFLIKNKFYKCIEILFKINN